MLTLRPFALPLRIRPNLRPTVVSTFKTLQLRALSILGTAASRCNRVDTGPVDYEVLKVTSRRWLYNNDIQMALRRLEFDVEALGRVAAAAGGASECTKIEFLAEGSCNRVFSLGLSNGKNVIARIPFPNAGPRSILTRSEVATMDFVRSRFGGAPIPKVLAWDSTTTNNVGCEYIIMERCGGTALKDKLGSDLEFYRHIADIAELMSGLACIRFSQYGSIYYKEDVDSELRARPLYADGEEQDELSERFRIGPSVQRRFYRGERARMSIDRGPWKDLTSYLEAAVNCELEWLRLYSNSPQAQKQPGAWNTPEEHAAMLRKWLHLAPAVLPSTEYYAPTLAHPDLHAGNILVTGDDPLSVSGFLDWQGAAVRPLFETEAPNIFIDDDGASDLKYITISDDGLYKPVLLENYSELTVEEKEEARAEFRRFWARHALHKFVLDMHAPLLVVLTVWHMELLKRAVYCSSRSWSEGLPLLERTMMSLSAEYGDSIPVVDNYPVCPVVFSEEDQKRHNKEYTKVIYAEQRLEATLTKAMKEAGIALGEDGSVHPDQFGAAVKKNEEVFAAIMASTGEVAQARIKPRWPVREGKFVYTMESCV
ncbi:hypothetical protein BDN70DRAFT_591828 [Pholiota conissans]|uniref:Altered inheritance of mitochondria protein 9, mitochondrial n=1 Tax=Pholiota conissans TaxID=109636 RepID=A0A9P6D763_9AGAR|nr:hypothetical protein BDN70DRAFT_591828 [Pholiota conissans]